MTATSLASDRLLPRLKVSPGTVLRVMLVAVDGQQCAGIDLESGSLVRAWCALSLGSGLRPYDVVEMTVSSDTDRLPDPSEPEAVPVVDLPQVIGTMSRRRAERLIRPLLHPRSEPLLGVHSPAVPFWERRPDRPSIALVEPAGPVMAVREPGYMSCRFEWKGRVHRLPCVDRQLASTMDQGGRLKGALRQGSRLVVALTPPIEGHCHKVIEAVLPRQ